MAQYQTRTGPIQNDASAITAEMVAGCLPSSPCRWKPSRGPSFFPFSGTSAPASPEMFAGHVPDRPYRWKPKPGWAWSETTFAAPMTPEMFAGCLPDRPGRSVTHASGLSILAEGPIAFSVEMVIGSLPSRSRAWQAPQIPQPMTQLDQSTSGTAHPVGAGLTIGAGAGVASTYSLQPSQTSWSGGGGGIAHRRTEPEWPRLVKKTPKAAPSLVEKPVRRIGLVFAHGAGLHIGAGAVTATGQAMARVAGAGVTMGAGSARAGLRRRMTDDDIWLLIGQLFAERDI